MFLSGLGGLARLAALLHLVNARNSKTTILVPETLPNSEVNSIENVTLVGDPGKIMEKFQGLLASDSFLCVSYPAGDADGRLSEGLEPTGRRDGECRDSSGQAFLLRDEGILRLRVLSSGEPKKAEVLGAYALYKGNYLCKKDLKREGYHIYALYK